MTHHDILIAGAGPTGLTVALHLAKHGFSVRIIEKLQEPSPHSKAFGVNPRTLTLLEDVGVTQGMLAQGWQMQAINAWKNGRHLFKVDLSQVAHKYPFMLVHSQAKSEALMREALTAMGVTIERGVALQSLQQEGETISVTLQHDSGQVETTQTPILFGADGSRSTVRSQLGIEFTGSAFDDDWQLYDLELDIALNPNEAHVFILEQGGMFIVRLDDRLWRIIGNTPEPLNHLPQGTSIGTIDWESSFKISSRVAERVAIGSAYLGGDAAHVHSGLGARGMNLGVEDAYVFAQLMKQNRLQEYQGVRHPIMTKIVQQTKSVTEIPRGKKTQARMMRTLIPYLAPVIIPIVSKHASTWVLGLDHEVSLA